MLHGALIGLDAGVCQGRCGFDGFCNFDRFVGGGNAAAARAAIDFDEALKGGAVLLRRGRKFGHVRHVIDADGDPRAAARQAREPVDFVRIAHLVRHEDVPDAATRKDLGFGNLLAADADRIAQTFLQLLHIDRLVHLAVAAKAHAVRFRVVGHLDDVALQRVEIEDQTGRLDIRLVHARQGGDVIADFTVGEIHRCVHGNLRGS